MTDQQPNPYLITPPPGLFPTRVADDVEESGTRKISPSRAPVAVRPPVGGGIPYVTPKSLEPQAPAPIPAPVVAAQWRLVLHDGSTLTVPSPLLLGRNPARPANLPGAYLLPLSDATKTVSKTHAVLEIDGQGIWVTDLDSTNGSQVALPNGGNTHAAPRQRTAVPAGSDLALGDYVIRVDFS